MPAAIMLPVQNTGGTICRASYEVRKVRTGKGALLRKAQMGVILCHCNRKQPLLLRLRP